MMNAKRTISSNIDNSSHPFSLAYFTNSSRLFKKAIEEKKLHFPNILPSPSNASNWPVTNQSQVLSDLVRSGTLKTMKFENGKNQSRRGENKRGEMDEELVQFEKISKKVKIQKDSQKQLSTPTTFSQELSENGSEINEMNCDSDSSVYSKESLLKISHIKKIQDLENTNQRKTCTNITFFYGKDNQEKLFKFEFYEHGISESKSIVFTKEQILQHDPRWILYFYENHLQFVCSPEFKPERMKRI